jgi:hypothetical protein
VENFSSSVSLSARHPCDDAVAAPLKATADNPGSAHNWRSACHPPRDAMTTRHARFGNFGSRRLRSDSGSPVTICDGHRSFVLASMWPSAWTAVPRRQGPDRDRTGTGGHEGEVEKEHYR